MIVQLAGTLLTKDLDRVAVMTSGGVGYELAIPIGVYESLPKPGEQVMLHTQLIVKEDGWQLYGFASAYERAVFQKVLDAKGVGPALALALLSSLTAERLVRAIRERDIATLQTVPRVGRKKAEQMILDLADKLDDVRADGSAAATPRPEGVGVDDAIRALVSLGYAGVDAERAVRAAVDAGPKGMSAPALIKAALARIRG